MRECTVVVVALLAGCRGDSRVKPVAGDAAVQAPGPALEADELVAVDVFGSRQVTRAQVLVALERPLRELAAAVAGRGSAMELDLEDDIHALGDFAYVKPSLVGYYEPEGMKYYLTIDLVDRADAARRMPFLPAPEGSYEDPDGLLDDWRAFEAKTFELLEARQMSPARSDCPAFHCLGDHAHPALAPLVRRFVERVPAQVDALTTILRDDADPTQRAAAAYLLAYGPDGQAVVSAMQGAFRDGDDLVRNSAMRVVADIAFHHPELDVPLEPVLDALEYPSTLDRNKAAAILDGLLERPGAARLHAAITSRSVATLLAMLRLEQPNNHDFAHDILQAISGQRFGERDHAAWERWFGVAGPPRSAP